MKKNSLLLALLLACPLSAQEVFVPEQSSSGYRFYEPAGGSFRCQIPAAWRPIEEESLQGPIVHIIEPEQAGKAYRSGIDVQLFEAGQPGVVPFKKAIDLLRREDKAFQRSATPVRLLRANGLLFRLFEVTETRLLPAESLPASQTPLHHYVAVAQSGESYFVLRLSSLRDVYLDYRNVFQLFVKSFRPLGYK